MRVGVMCLCKLFSPRHQIRIDIPRMSPECLMLQPMVTEVRLVKGAADQLSLASMTPVRFLSGLPCLCLSVYLQAPSSELVDGGSLV